MGNCCNFLKKDSDIKKENTPLIDLSRNNTLALEDPKRKVSKVDDLQIHSALIVQEINSDPYEIYDFLEVLGEGSYGKVTKVKHKKLDIVRAMKEIEKYSSDNGSMNEENLNDLLREIEILKSLDHPNIIKIYQYFNTKNKIFIAFEFCSGGELFDQLVRARSFKEKNIAYIMRQLISAVNFLHLNGIIHRDLKPENIVIENQLKKGQETFTIKLIDFGTSRMYRNKSHTKKRNFKECIGSSYYMAPEVLNENYNEKCDVWSLGVIMYMLLSGTPPFNGNDDYEIFESIENSSLKFPEKYFKNVSEEAIDLIKNLINRDVKKRFSAQEALDHKWFKSSFNDNEEIDSEKLENISESLRKFNCNQKFQQACVSYIVHNMLKNEEIVEYRKIFQKFDKNSDGRLSREELIQGFGEIMSPGEAKEEVNRLIDSIDSDKNNYIEFEEFLSAFMDKKKLFKEENLKETFKLFDKDDSGSITIDEVKSIMGGKAIVKNQVWDEILSDVDQNSDGKISYEEFKGIMKKMIIDG